MKNITSKLGIRYFLVFCIIAAMFSGILTYSGADQRDVSKNTFDVAMDSNGNTYLVYRKNIYIYYKEWINGQWSGEEQIGLGDTPAIAVDHSGVPNVVYNLGNNIQYIKKINGVWTEPVSIAGHDADIDVDNNGYAHIVYSGNPPSYTDLCDLMYINNTLGSFKDPTKISDKQVGKSICYYNSPSIKIDNNGKYHIAVGVKSTQAIQIGGIKYEYYIKYINNKSSGFKSGQSTAVNDSSLEISKNGFDVDSTGNAYLVYYNSSKQYFVNLETSWREEALTLGSSLSASMDSQNKMHIAYEDGSDISYIEKNGERTTYTNKIDEGSNPIVVTGASKVEVFYLQSDNIYCRVIGQEESTLVVEALLGETGGSDTKGVVHFIDVPTSSQAYEAVDILYSRNIVKGMDEESFSPDANVTRAQFAALLVRSLGLDLEDYQGIFKDVPEEAWYAHEVEAAQKVGLVKGIGNDEFSPDKFASREEIAVMISNFLKIVPEKIEGNVTQEFQDMNNVSDWAKDAVRELKAKGIMIGVGEDKFIPKGTMERGLAAELLLRTFRVLGGIQ